MYKRASLRKKTHTDLGTQNTKRTGRPLLSIQHRIAPRDCDKKNNKRGEDAPQRCAVSSR